jgi:DNA-directed RNA polymerase subunit M
MVKFCPDCGSFCQPDPVKKCYVCPTCEWEEPLEENLSVSRDNNKNVEKIVVVSKKDRQLSTMPKTKMLCEKCGNNEAFWWMVQTRSIDESMTQFFRCTKCSHTWRDYS